ncbi:MAG: AAA family ATPase [Planctomycetota bacterium]
MTRRIDIQLVGSESLAAEVRAAAEVLDGAQYVVRSEPDFTRGVEAVRDRGPEVCVLDLSTSASVVQAAAEELNRSTPGTLLVAAYRPDQGGALEQREEWIALMRAGLRDFLRRPVSARELAEVLERQVQGTRRGGATGRLACFASNKGGVGKSTLALNAAVLLAKSHPGRVLLVDASLQLGTCASMLDLDPESTVTDATRELYRLDETLLRTLSLEHRSGLHLLAAPRDASEAAEIDDTSMGRVLAVARRTFDWVIVDTFPLLDGIAMTALDLADRVWVVTTPAVPTLRGTAAYLEVIERLGVPRERIRIALNGAHPSFAGALSDSDVAARLDRPVDERVRHAKGFLISSDQGVPFVERARGFSGASRALRRIARDIEALPTRHSEPVGQEVRT